MTTLNLPIPGLPALLAAEYPTIRPADYNDRDLNNYPKKLIPYPTKANLLEVWLTTTSGSGIIHWTTIYDPFDDGDARGQVAWGDINAPGAGEHFGTSLLLHFGGGTIGDPYGLNPADIAAATADIAALKAAQDAAADHEAFWIRLEYTGPVLSNINIHFVLYPRPFIRKTHRRDGYEQMSATRIDGRIPIERIGGHHP